MSSTHYKSNVRDIFFNLFEVLDIEHTSLGKGPFAGMDGDTARAAITGLEEFVQKELAPSFAEADEIGLRLQDGNITLPASMTRGLRAYYENGWNKLELPERLGGYGAPPTVQWAAFELVAGAHAAVCFYLLGNFLSKIIDALGTDDQKRRYLDNMVNKHWGGTMVLTEPDAGSDVGAGTTRAKHVAGDEYHLEGVKRFITNGDFDQPENIVHMVLARPEGAGPGTKGLSMFIVPKFWVEADGSVGARNGIVVSNLEKKMGLKASATCELTLGGDVPCRGLLVGNVHNGIAQMFHIIEYARMAVGSKSMTTLSTAYLNALDYTKVRKQGADLAKAADKSAPRVEIIRHPDVRRMLMTQKVYAEGLRALVYWTANLQDRIAIGGDAAETKALEQLNDLALPLIKGFASEKVYELLSVSLQCYGGSGYLTDYPIEQYIRDQKIDSLYEGTTHIQALDLFFRKVGRDRGQTLQRLMGEIKATSDSLASLPDLAVEKAALERASGDVGAIFMAMMGKTMQSVYHAGFQGNRILFALAELVIGWRLVVAAKLAHGKLGAAVGDDRHFYQGKLAAARFYAKNVLPGLGHVRKLIEDGDLDLMELADEAF